MQTFSWRDIAAEWDERRLVFGNRAFRRTVDLSGGYPRTVSLCRVGGPEYADPGKTSADAGFIGLNPPGRHRTGYRILEVAAQAVEAPDFEAPHVLVSLRYCEAVEQAEFRREFIIYPELPAHGVRNAVRTAVMPQLYWSERGALRDDNRQRHPAEALESRVESLLPAAGFRAVRTVEFAGRTDYTDELVVEHPVAAGVSDAALTGNLLYLENAAGAGLAILQEAPPSAERRDFEAHDFRIAGGELISCNWGIPPAEVRPDRFFQGCRNAVLLYADAAERARVQCDYLAHRFPMRPREYSVMVNPWGCGRFPELVGGDFLLAELEAAAECGADTYQIDDSWQQGGSLAELMHNRLITPDFWQISTDRLNGTFSPLVRRAAEVGVRLALWTAPSANVEYRDHAAFAEMLLDFHRRYGFELIKIDGVQLRTYEAECNLEALLAEVRRRSGGRVYFNLDTTNGQRPGYFRMLEYGNIFLENRYVCHDWSIGYHPEKTLRSLWRLAHYVRPQSLQIEIPTPEGINPELYRKRQLSMPDRYPFAYWAAIALFANPLIWTAPSRIAVEHRAALRELMTLHRACRDELFAGRIFPLGAAPDGRALTGFYADSGFLIVYREADCAESSGVLAGAFAAPAFDRAERLAGAGKCAVTPDGFAVTLPEPASFGVFRLR